MLFFLLVIVIVIVIVLFIPCSLFIGILIFKHTVQAVWVCFLSGRLVISGHMERNHISKQVLRCCPTTHSTWSSSVLPLYTISFQGQIPSKTHCITLPPILQHCSNGSTTFQGILRPSELVTDILNAFIGYLLVDF